MQDLNYWKQFENTGKIEDYLNYCSCVAQERSENTPVPNREQAEQSGVNPYAGIH